MADKEHQAFQLEVVTPNRLIVSEEVQELVAPGVEGYFGVWPGHAPFMTTLKFGELSYKRRGEERFLAVGWGYAEILPEKAIILVENAERSEEIDVPRAEQAKAKAEECLRRGDETIDFAQTQAALERALTRLSVAGKGR